ncbi:lateral signaling target protein 2 homolog isoform X1 [Anopheles ziemanni]|uniref:lateral signaling target protein 2 homolog isoform X1 n=1 Tax=Anopheles coustani TaxID=139045 RepID=UPI002659DDBD|nr:lateral signaling target protein 2 homolog isoform X1 [Anopheles coustani]XP_058168050.1 lateral signaling target protein 2 homolog isoform X1 [Anopheles ziemanni]
MQSHGHNIMTRIRTHSSSLESYSTTEILAASSSTALESSIMDPSDALVGTSDRDTGMADVEGSSPIHHNHHHHHHHPVTMALMNGVTITVTSNGSNNNNNIADEDDDKCPTDKDGSDLRAIDFASATNHHSESQESVLDFDGSAVDDDNDGHGSGMMVDSMEVAEIAINSSNSNSSSGSSSSNSSSSSSNSSNSSSASSNSEKPSNQQPQPTEVEGEATAAAAEEEQDDEEEEEDDDEEEDEDDARGEDDGEDRQEAAEVANGGADESTSDDKIMRTADDPLLQETINALMNGTGGIEVVKLESTPAASAVASVIAAVVAGTEMATERTVANDELETDRNYQCTYCGKLFTRSNTLSYHLKVHTGERPFKCKHCSKAFREQYRLMKHIKTHAKCRNRRMERTKEVQRVSNGREHLHRKASVSSLVHPMMGGNSLASAEEDCATGDSDRFFKHYDLPDGAAAMKLEPDISLTEEGMSEVHDPDAMLTEEVEVMDEGQMACGMEETIGDPGVTLTADASDIRHQIIEERIKSLQREVHLVNQNLNRVESKVDGLTRIISLLIEKFEEDVDPAQRLATNGSQTIPAEDASIVPVTSLTVVAQQATPSTAITAPSSTSSLQPKTLLLSSTPAQQNSVNQQQTTVYTHVATVGQPTQLQQTVVPLKESRSGNTQYYQFTEPAIAHSKTTATSAPTSVTVTPSPSPTPPPSSVQSQPFTIAHSGGHSITGVMNGNQLLDAFPEIPELPIRTVSDFLDLNDHCTDNEQFLLQMMIRLHQEIHNSQPFQRNIKRMMEALVTYEVLCQFSWSGKSAINGQYTKYVFGNSLGIIDLLTKTLNLGKSAEEAEANQKPIFAAIQSFIKHSRQNMIRDSRKRRDPMRGGAGGAGDTGGGGDGGSSGGAITFHLNGSDRFQTKLIKSEHSAHQQQELVNPQF